MLWPHDVRANTLEKTLMLGKIEGGRRRGQQMVGWHQRLDGHKFEQTLGDGEGQGGLTCCSPWGHKESDMTERLNDSNTESLAAQTGKRLPAMQETRVRSLGREDPLEKEMAPHSSTIAWKIPWMEEPGGLQSTGSQRVGHD